MKITDFSIMFSAIFISFYISYYISEQAMFGTVYTATVMNNVMDEVVVDALEAGYSGCDSLGNPIVDKEEMLRVFKMECFRVLEDGSEDEVPVIVKKIIYLEEDKYFVYENNAWSQAILIKDLTHEEQMEQISKSLKKSIPEARTGRYQISLPYNDGEWDSQTLQPYSVVVLCEQPIMKFLGEQYGICFLSGAAVKEVSIKSVP